MDTTPNIRPTHLVDPDATLAWKRGQLAAVIAFVMLRCGTGQQLVKGRRYQVERPLAEFL